MAEYKEKTGLVMEGGAMRGMFTAGVIDVMMEHNIRFDGAVGVSAGAAFGCNYKSRQPGRVIRYNTRFCKDPRFCSFRSLLKTGDLFGADFCYRVVPQQLDVFDTEQFSLDPMEFYVVCTDTATGEAVYYRCETGKERDLDLIRASASMPLVSRPVEIDGRSLLDGGIADSIPLRYFEEIGYRKNVVILTQPRGYRKTPNKLAGLMKLLLRKHPKVAKTMKRRHLDYNEAADFVFAAEKEGRAFVFCPPEPLQVGRIEHDPDKLRAAYETGRKTAEEKLPALLTFLEH